jgi:hypothetical protein
MTYAYKAVRMTPLQRCALQSIAQGQTFAKFAGPASRTAMALERKRLISWTKPPGTMRFRWLLTGAGRREAQRLGYVVDPDDGT